MMPCVLSIVVPAYNVERFIGRCVSSVDAQHMASRVEVIVVDDGSTDETARIVSDLASRTEGVRIICQPNGGLGAARNRGFDQACGDYVWFVDGDDFLEAGAVKKVVASLEEHAPDILVVDFTCADEDGAPVKWIACPFDSNHGQSTSGAGFFRRHHATTYAWLYVFRRKLLAEHGIKFQPRINMQDAELLPRAMAVAGKVIVSGIDAYVYVKRVDSFINNPDPGVRERYFRSVVEVRQRLLLFLDGLDESEIREGVAAKLRSLDRILLRSYVYDSTDAIALSGRLSLLRSEGVHPFAPFIDAGAKDRLLRLAVNLQPLRAPRVYRWIRSRSMFQRVAERARGMGHAA